ncbi:MAG TPA: PP2C family protein-serine/threonine phosphatase, partial [Aggregatilineales bacterium]|nr:PP2C family protein-serine/threonine phosphatase [Aggregatilineales bacterium]
EARNTVSPSSVLENANTSILEDNRTRLFMSAFYALLNLKTGEMRFANGGHDYPILLSGEQCRFLEVDGYVLGAFRDIHLTEQQIYLNHGDALILYTDGITEARSTENGIFGENRLLDVVTGMRNSSAEEIAAAILNAVGNFADNDTQSDDFTLLVVKRL